MPANDQYRDRVLDPTAPARKAFAITPSDTEDVTTVPRSIYIGGEGDVAVIMGDDSASVVFRGASGLLPLMVKRVLATGTTATYIVGVL